MEDIKRIWKVQQFFNNKVFPKPKNLKDKQSLTKEFILHLISESDEVLREINWKFHRGNKKKINKDKLLEELIDVFKYNLSIMQFWDISPSEFYQKFLDKSEIVEQRFIQEKKINLLDDKKILCIDIDGIIADYPRSFINFIESKINKKVIINFTEYKLYDIIQKATGLSKKKIEKLKHEYRVTGYKRNISLIKDAKKYINLLAKEYTIVLLSARPYEKYPRIFSDTIFWLKKNRIKYNAILWDVKKEERMLKELPHTLYMIEDCGENAIKIAINKKKVILLNKDYNQNFKHKNIIRVNTWKEIYKKIKGEN
ncbi:hypothetical protein EOM09_01880 [bacterium]|nr:hypothetical protein [bacterium]